MPRKSSDLFKFWDELKRRKVIKAALVYLAVAFGIIQAVDIILPRLGLPDWTVTFVLILLIIVFILVIVLTWIYDITPEGIKVTKDFHSKSEEEKKERPEKGDDLQKTDEITEAERDENDLQQKLQALEDQLREARKASLRSLWPTFFKKIVIPVLIAAILLVMVFNKQRIIEILGFGDAKREIARTHNANATLYINSGDYEVARSEVDMALESDPEYSYAWSNMAVISYRQGDLDKAVSQVIKAVSLDSKNSQAPYNLAYLLDDKKDYKQAIYWYKEAIRIDSLNKVDSVYTAASSSLGRLYNSIGLPSNAIIVLNRVRGLFPKSKNISFVYKNLGNAYLLQNQTDSAMKYLELSNAMNPSQPETIMFLAKACEASGKVTRSIELWQNYIELETDTSKINAAIRHRKKLAIKQLQEIIK